MPCQQFIICISNFSGVNTLVSFTSIGTASLTCNPTCINVTSPTLCAGGSAPIIASTSGMQPGITYSINPGGATASTPTFVVSPLVDTQYTVYATGLNSNNLAITQTAVSSVTVYPSSQVSPTVTQATCLDPSNGFTLGLTFLPTSANPAYNITWAPTPIGIATAQQTINNGTISPGTYNFTVTTAGGCSAISSVSINSTPAPATISFSPAPAYVVTCAMPTVNVTAVDPANSYTWSNNGSGTLVGASAAFHSNSIGVWTVTAQNNLSGCLDTRTISVGLNTVIPTSALSPTFQNITCNLSSINCVTAAATPTINISHHFYSPSGTTVFVTKPHYVILSRRTRHLHALHRGRR